MLSTHCSFIDKTRIPAEGYLVSIGYRKVFTGQYCDFISNCFRNSHTVISENRDNKITFVNYALVLSHLGEEDWNLIMYV